MLSWVVAESIAGRPFDRGLEHNVKALVQLIKTDRQHLLFNLPSPAREILRADDTDIIYYQVIGAHGELVSGDGDFPMPPEDDKSSLGEMHLRDDKMHGVNIRVAYEWVKVDLPNAKPVLVQVGETLEKRSVLATEIIKGVLLPQLVVLPLVVLLVWLALGHGIEPLNALGERIRQRKPDDMSPLEGHYVPKEIAPLVASFLGRRGAPTQNTARGIAYASGLGTTRRFKHTRIKKILAIDWARQHPRYPHRQPIVVIGAR
jgi:two-component system sensor histidine kinase TctE